MCIVSFAWKAHPKWQLIAIGNRDEFHARAAVPARRWEEPGHLLAGRDLQAGGTWLGVSEEGRFAVVTNLHGFGAPQPERSSRGDLLKDFLSGSGRYADIANAKYADFNPFNLITVESREAWVHSNRPDEFSTKLDQGIHGLSNGLVHHPWPKSARLNNALEKWMVTQPDDPAMLLDCLGDQNTFGSKGNLVSASVSEFEPRHSAIFIKSPEYGTRCSTVVAIDHRGNGIFIERRYAPAGAILGETHLPFSWPML